MDRRLLFQDLLDRLAEERDVGVDDHIALGKLLSRSDGASIAELRLALGALFGRDAEGVKRVHAIFDELYVDPARISPPPPPPPPPPPLVSSPLARAFAVIKAFLWGTTRARRLTALAFVSLLVAVVFAPLVVGQLTPPEAPWPRPSLNVRVPESRRHESIPPPRYAPMPGCETWTKPGVEWLEFVAASLGFLLVASFFAYRRYHGFRASRRKSLRRARWAEHVGVGGQVPPFRVASSFDVSPLRNAAYRLESRREIDVDRTVNATVERGSFPTIVTRRRAASPRMLLLQQTGAAAAAFQPHFDAVHASLIKRGVEVERLYFQHSIDAVAHAPRRRSGRLVDLARHTVEWPLIILATGESLGSSLQERPRGRTDDVRPPGERDDATTNVLMRQVALRELLAPWPARALLTPLSDGARLDVALRGTNKPVPVFALDAPGLRAAARAIESRGADASRISTESFRLLPSEVLRLRAMMAFATSRSFALAERLRARFFPAAPLDIVRAATSVVREGTQATEAREAVEWFRGLEPGGDVPPRPRGDEAEVRAFLRELIEEVKPVGNASGDAPTLAELRWRRDRALQLAHSDDASERTAAVREFESLAATPLRAEIDALLASQDLPPALAAMRTKLAELPGEAASEPGFFERISGARPTVLQTAISFAASLFCGGLVHQGIQMRSGPILIGETRSVYSDTELIRGLCQLDAIGAVARFGTLTSHAQQLIVGTMPSDNPVLRRIVQIKVQERPFGRDVTVQLVSTQSLSGPDHIGFGFMNWNLNEMVFTAGIEQQGPITWGPMDPQQIEQHQSAYGYFPYLNYEIGQFDYYHPGNQNFQPSGRRASPTVASQVHNNYVQEMSHGLLPGSVDDVLLRLVGQRALADSIPLPDGWPPRQEPLTVLGEPHEPVYTPPPMVSAEPSTRAYPAPPPIDCARSSDCLRSGRCNRINGRCVADSASCRSSKVCQTDELCGERDGSCVACNESIECGRMGSCSLEAGKCVARSDDACAKSTDCGQYGHCHAQNGKCRATTPSDCKPKGVGCLARGLCTLDPKLGSCVATDDSCLWSDDCRQSAMCTARAGSCVQAPGDCGRWPGCNSYGKCGDGSTGCIATPKGCIDSAQCKGEGLCTLRSGVCSLTSDEDCRRTNACFSDGLCSYMRGAELCAAKSSEDCARSTACQSQGRCTAMAGICVK